MRQARQQNGSERQMAVEYPRLKLGKRAAFVKTHLKRLPQAKETWEADFRALPKPRGQTDTHYLGLVVALPIGDPLVYLPLEYRPNVNDLADLLADAMHRPLTGFPRRPDQLHLRNNPQWQELFRHLNELGIATSIHEQLPMVEEAHEDFLREMRHASPGPIIMVSPGRGHVAKQFPAMAQWVQGYGHNEIGELEGIGLVVRALDSGGLVFEDNKAETLAEAMAALEKGLAKWFGEQELKLK
jgi:hypothetical protein